MYILFISWANIWTVKHNSIQSWPTVVDRFIPYENLIERSPKTMSQQGDNQNIVVSTMQLMTYGVWIYIRVGNYTCFMCTIKQPQIFNWWHCVLPNLLFVCILCSQFIQVALFIGSINRCLNVLKCCFYYLEGTWYHVSDIYPQTQSVANLRTQIPFIHFNHIMHKLFV